MQRHHKLYIWTICLLLTAIGFISTAFLMGDVLYLIPGGIVYLIGLAFFLWGYSVERGDR